MAVRIKLMALLLSVLSMNARANWCGDLLGWLSGSDSSKGRALYTEWRKSQYHYHIIGELDLDPQREARSKNPSLFLAKVIAAQVRLLGLEEDVPSPPEGFPTLKKRSGRQAPFFDEVVQAVRRLLRSEVRERQSLRSQVDALLGGPHSKLIEDAYSDWRFVFQEEAMDVKTFLESGNMPPNTSDASLWGPEKPFIADSDLSTLNGNYKTYFITPASIKASVNNTAELMETRIELIHQFVSDQNESTKLTKRIAKVTHAFSARYEDTMLRIRAALLELSRQSRKKGRLTRAETDLKDFLVYQSVRLESFRALYLSLTDTDTLQNRGRLSRAKQFASDRWNTLKRENH